MLNRLGFEVCGVTLTRRELPQAPGLVANRVSDPPAVAAAETTPGPPMVSAGEELVQVAVLVTTCVEPSDMVAVATSERFCPAGTEVRPGGVLVIFIEL